MIMEDPSVRSGADTRQEYILYIYDIYKLEGEEGLRPKLQAERKTGLFLGQENPLPPIVFGREVGYTVFGRVCLHYYIGNPKTDRNT